MPISCIYEGKVLDYHFYKRRGPKGYEFYIDNIRVGIVVKSGKSWTAIPGNSILYPFSMIDGFRTRLDAAEYLLKYMGYRPREGEEKLEGVRFWRDAILKIDPNYFDR